MELADDGLDEWVTYLSRVEIPVLNQTARGLNRLRQDPTQMNPRNVSDVVDHDPLMTAKVLRYSQRHRRETQVHELVEVEQAIVMMGMNAFLDDVPAKPTIEEILRGQVPALTHLLHVVRRSQHASRLAMNWAVRMQDARFAEVGIAALLRNLAELLMWCFATGKMLEIRHIQTQHRSVRSKIAQEAVFGFSGTSLQVALVKQWGLPELLLKLMDEACSDEPRVRTVALAANLARHVANGWDDPALPDDYSELAQLLHMPVDRVMSLVGATTRAWARDAEAAEAAEAKKPG